MSLPLVSVVVPSYNKAPYVREAIESILDQTYPHVEILVHDAESNDGTVDVLREFGDRISLVVEKDRGQCDALNRGFARARGDILTWLCADDVFFPDAIERVVAYFDNEPDTRLIYGRGWHVDGSGNYIRTIQNKPHDLRRLVNVDYILQPATFWRREVYERIGGLDLDYQWGLDWDYWLRAARHYPLRRVDDVFAKFRLTPDIKTLSGGVPRLGELARICRRHGGMFQPSHIVLGTMYAFGTLLRPFGLQERMRHFLKRVFKVFYGERAMYG